MRVTLDFMPAFYTRHLGLRWGEGYYFDPAYRAEVEVARDRFLYDVLGQYGVGSAAPTPVPSLFIQPVDLFMRTQDAEWRFPDDGTVESWGRPWEGMSVSEILALDSRAAAAHPVIDAIIDQYAELRKLYGDDADVLGLRTGQMIIHGPYTTAHQVIGEGIFMLMHDDAEGAQQVFAKIWEIYQAFLGRIAQAVEAPPIRRVHIGDCAASQVSPECYRQNVLPADNAIARGFDTCGYHSCGPSTHLLDAFAQVRGVDSIQLGQDTDLLLAERVFDETVELQPLVDAVPMREGTPNDVHELIAPMAAVLRRRGRGMICAWAFDADTPIENVAAMYDTVAECDT